LSAGGAAMAPTIEKHRVGLRSRRQGDHGLDVCPPLSNCRRAGLWSAPPTKS
jgi:hypothetical protein